MTLMLKRTALGLALLGAAAAPALAGDWNTGAPGIKDMRGVAAVPVPAPQPIPVHKAEWYFRADFGYGFAGGRDASETGMQYGLLDSPGTTGPEPFGNRSSWFNNEFDTFYTMGGGVGYYFSDRVRGDITLEAISQGTARIDGVERYDVHAFDTTVAPPVYGRLEDAAGNPTTRASVYVSDSTKLTTYLAMLNGYYELGRLHGLSPYVGAGLGVAYHHISRRHQTNETECDLTTAPPCQSEFLQASYSSASKQTGYGLAAALTAGLTYSVTDITSLDLNYRYLYVEGTDVRLNIIDGNGTQHRSTVTIGETSEHQLRAGLRFNVQ